MVYYPGIVHAKDSQDFVLIPYQKSLQNTAQTSGKSLHVNNKLPLQYCPFSRYSSCKRKPGVLCIFPNYSSTLCKKLSIQMFIHHLQSSSFPGVFNAPNSQVFLHIATAITFRIRAVLPAKRMQFKIKIPFQCCPFCTSRSSKL